MRIERVEGNRKIRVLLSQDDLLEMNINIRTLTPDSPELHSFLFKVMEFVRRETGFSAGSGQVVVEASPLGEGIVLTVTTLEPERKRKLDISSVRVKKKLRSSRKIYRFADFDSLCDYFKQADDCIAEEMSLYSYREAFFAAAAAEDCKIHEFAAKISDADKAELFLSEHGRLIAAGEELKKMINGIKNLK